jgi:prephenate dehydrogenase
MRIALLGLGLIGGSIAKALREDPASAGPLDATGLEIAAWTPSSAGPRAALEAGAVDHVARTIAEAVDGAALIVICAPPIAATSILDELVICRRSGRLAEGAVITDVLSTKRWIMAEAAKRTLRFCGGHPMAGKHETGFAAADASLFVGRPWVVVPDHHGASSAAALVERLAATCGARPIVMDAELHDAATAAVSHLPILVAAALVSAVSQGEQGKAVDGWRVSHLLASSGWSSATRLARGSDEMGADILATNAAEVRRRLRALRDELERWDARLAAAERDPLLGRTDIRARLAEARETLEELG